MKNDKQNPRRDEWRKIVDEYLTSDMTQKSFCEQHEVSLPRFVYYHSQFRREKDPQTVKPGFVPVKIPQHEKAATTSEIKLSLPNGFQCSFSSHTDAAQINRLVEVLLSC